MKVILSISVFSVLRNLVSSNSFLTGKPHPEEGILSRYLDAAMRHANVRASKDGIWYAAIPGLGPAWGRGQFKEGALRDLRRSLESVVLASIFDHIPLPAFDGISLKLTKETGEGIIELYSSSEITELDPLSALDS